jgi:CHAT domain-containing protein
MVGILHWDLSQALPFHEAEAGLQRAQSIAILQSVPNSPESAEILAAAIIDMRWSNESNKGLSKQAYHNLVSVSLNRHREAFGDVERQISLWSELLNSAPDDAETLKQLHANRIQVLERIDNRRALLEGRLDLMQTLIAKEQPFLAIEIARKIKHELKERMNRDVTAPSTNGCRWLDETYSASLSKVIASQGSDLDKQDLLQLSIVHSVSNNPFAGDMYTAFDNLTPAMAARFVDYAAFRSALAQAAPNRDPPICGPAPAACSAQTLASAALSLGAFTIGTELYRDAIQFAEESSLSPEVLSELRLAAADANWKYGSPSYSLALMEKLGNRFEGQPKQRDTGLFSKYYALRADAADAQKSPADASHYFERLVGLAIRESNRLPSGDNQAAELLDATNALTLRFLLKQFCHQCGPNVAGVAQRWLDFTFKTKLVDAGTKAILYVLTRNLAADTINQRPSGGSYSFLMRQLGKEWSDAAKSYREHSKGKIPDDRLVADIAAFLFSSSNDSMYPSEMKLFVNFLSEPDPNKKLQIWHSYFDETASTQYEQFGADTSLHDRLFAISAVLETTGRTDAAQTVLQYLLEKADPQSDRDGRSGIRERENERRAALLVSVHTKLAALSVANQRWSPAANHLDEAARLVENRLSSEWIVGDERVSLLLRDLHPSLQLMVDTRAQLSLALQTDQDIDEHRAGIFRELQLAMLGDTAVSLQAAQRRRILSEPDLLQSAKERDLAVSELASLMSFKDIVGILDQAVYERRRGQLEVRIKELTKFLQGSTRATEDLAELRPIDLTAARALLQPREAIVILYPTRDSVVGMLIPINGRVRVWRESISADVLQRRIASLRDGVIVNADSSLPAFSVTQAFELYRLLFGSVHEELSSVSSLLVATSGALQSLPLGILIDKYPSRVPSTPGQFRDAKLSWLALQFPINYLPTLRSLQVRLYPKLASTGTQPFIGIGNPRLDGQPKPIRDGGYSKVFARAGAEGGRADISALRALPRLPETEVELTNLGRFFKVEPTDLIFGNDATEGRVKSLRLDQYRIIAFATHGLVAGRTSGLAEPGLVLSPPVAASATDDGFLTASEIARLTLDADLVILSACNTAAADGRPGAEGLSGIARAFLAAGARSLIVTHWAIPSAPAVEITTKMVQLKQESNAMGCGEALRSSLRELIELRGPSSFAHPANWGAFVLVGAQADQR